MMDISFIIAHRSGEGSLSRFLRSVNQWYLRESKEVIVISRDRVDDHEFNKGELLNAGARHAQSDQFVFVDIDCRFLYHTPITPLLRAVNWSVTPFTHVLGGKDTKHGFTAADYPREQRLGFGFCTFVPRKHFEDCGGFPNTVFGFGVEEAMFHYRSKHLRFGGIVGNVGTCVGKYRAATHDRHQALPEDDDPASDGWRQASDNVEDLGVKSCRYGEYRLLEYQEG